MAYVKIIYQNSPSTNTPINSANLNHMDDQIALNDQRLTEIETSYVKSFNGRKGEVTPQANDYDMSQITPTSGATVGQIPIVRNDGTEEEPNLTFHMEDVPSSGHVIKDQFGTALAQEENLQFPDSHVTDDSQNNVTIVENIKEVSPADYASTTDEGIIVCDDGDDAVIGAVSDDYVEVVADGVKTFAQIFADLRAEADLDKMTLDATLVIDGTDVYKVAYKTTNGYQFARASSSSSGARVQYASLILNSEGFNISTGSTNNDASSSHPSNGMKFTLYYGNKKAIVDLQTTANRCLMSDGETTVADIIECDKTTAGTYALKCTVDAQGNKTYSWA